MKVLYLTSRFPYPLEKGDKLRAYYQIEALAHNHDVHLVSISEDEISKSDLDKISNITKSLVIIRITYWERWISLIKAMFSGLPFQIAWFYSKNISNDICQIANEIQPDHVFCQLPRMAEYGSKLPFAKTLDYMDCFGIGMQRRAGIAKGPASWIYQWEAYRMIKYEATISNSFDHLTIISQQDKNQFKFPRANEINVVTNGISDDFFNFKKDNEIKYDLVFVGNMNYLPNVESVEYLINKILPAYPKKLKVLVAGASPSQRVKKLASDQITVSGWIDDIRTAYTSAKIFVAPMWSGTGQQNKILEAMALGIPCVTTSIVNNAIGAKPGIEILEAETKQEFVDCIQKLMEDQHLYHSVSTHSIKFVQQNFDWKQNGLILSSIFANNLKK